MNRNDEWQTPQWLFDELYDEFLFDIDLCATEENRKCEDHSSDYFSWPADIYCRDRSEGQGVNGFINPPYSKPLPFIKKAWQDSKLMTIVCVLPAKTDTKWFRVFWDVSTHRPKEGAEVRFFPYRANHKSRVAFINPETGKPQQGNPCGTCIVVMDRRGIT